MKCIVTGSRSFDDYGYMWDRLLDMLPRVKVELVSGGEPGADKLAERFAEEHDFEITVMRALWQQYGRRAGIIRNEKMAEYCEPGDMLIAFWDGKSPGTSHMIGVAMRRGLDVHVLQGWSRLG